MASFICRFVVRFHGSEKKNTVPIAYNITTKGSYRRHASVGIIVSTNAPPPKKKKPVAHIATLLIAQCIVVQWHCA